MLALGARHPKLAILLVSLLAVMVNCFPIIFCGRSYVSPFVGGVAMVYDTWPPLPGMKPVHYTRAEPPFVGNHGSDTEATLIGTVPEGFIESRSLLNHGEIPLWNRYGHAGYTLIGQAISMLGDPLQAIVILGRGSAAAWDIKFLLAKFLFCAGFGLLVLRLLGSGGLSLLYAALGAYCGAFFFIYNHPVFFVFAYAPWILLSALQWLGPPSPHRAWWGLTWLLANFACFNAGHVEVAVDFIGGLNLAALIWRLTLSRNVSDVARVLGRLVAGTILFLGLTAPVWLTFLATLPGSYSIHSKVHVLQLSIWLLPGAFDDLFYQVVRSRLGLESAFAPGSSLLVLAGCILSVLQWRRLKGERFVWINAAAILLWGGCVFGWVPAFVLGRIPLLNRVGHVYTDFSYLLVIHLTLQSAFGFKALAGRTDFKPAALDCLWTALVIAAMIALFYFRFNLFPQHAFPSDYLGGNGSPAYSAAMTPQPFPWDYFGCAAAGAVGAPLLFLFLKNRNHALSAAGWAGILVLAFIPQLRFGLYPDGNSRTLLLPGSRPVLNAPSQAIGKIKTDTTAPFRIVGLDWNFHGDYAAVYGLEDIGSCAPLSNKAYIALLTGFPGMKRSSSWMVQVQSPAQAHPLLNLLNVKYVLADSSSHVHAPPGFRVADRGDFLVYENLQAWPRAFFSDKVLSIASNGQFMRYLSTNAIQPWIALTPQEIKALPALQTLEATKEPVVSAATHYHLLPNSTAFDIHAPSAGVVCLTEGQAPDFTATANGKPEKVLTVNRAFKGIFLGKAGDYHIRFTYRPAHWKLACILFWISGLLALAWAARESFRKKGPIPTLASILILVKKRLHVN
ncbi:MAG: hypothetical protein KGJ88_13150 [Verrucomicrobiota bacterium]|nr:hypothetical protein [Verrucomicrobiota bacterium]